MRKLLNLLTFIPFIASAQFGAGLSGEAMMPYAGLSGVDMQTGAAASFHYKQVSLRGGYLLGVQVRENLLTQNTYYAEVSYRHYEESLNKGLYFLGNGGVFNMDDEFMPSFGLGIGFKHKWIDANVTNRFLYRDNFGSALTLSVGVLFIKD